MTWICYVGIEISANFQKALLGVEVTMLIVMSVWASSRGRRFGAGGTLGRFRSCSIPSRSNTGVPSSLASRTCSSSTGVGHGA